MAQYLWLRLLAQGRAQRTSAASATTTSRSMAGAAPRSTTSCASRRIFPAPRSSPRAQLSLHRAHPAGRSSGLIAHQRGPPRQDALYDDELGEKPAVTACGTRKKKRAPSAKRSSSWQRRGRSLDDGAILVRASFQMREFEDRFITLGLPYRVIGGPRFYERAEIRDASPICAASRNPADDLAFERIVNVPKRGLGDATMQIVHDVWPRAQHLSLMQRGRRVLIRDRRTQAEGAPDPARCSKGDSRPLAPAARP